MNEVDDRGPLQLHYINVYNPFIVSVLVGFNGPTFYFCRIVSWKSLIMWLLRPGTWKELVSVAEIVNLSRSKE